MSTLPAEIVFEIIGYVDVETLESLSHTSQQYSALVQNERDHNLRVNVRNLKERVERIPHITTWMSFDPPPVIYVQNRGTGQTTGGFISRPNQFCEVVYDESAYTSVDEYLQRLEDKSMKSKIIADFAAKDIPYTPSNLMVPILHLFSAYERCVDRSCISMTPGLSPEDAIPDPHIQSLPENLKEPIFKVYFTLCKYLNHPSQGQLGIVQSTWLYQMIIRGGINDVFDMMKKRGLII